MTLTAQIAKHIREFYAGENWTGSNLKQHLADLTWQQATTPVYSFNTIADLVYHINYYVGAIVVVFQGGALEARDEFSFFSPPIRSRNDWEKLLDKAWNDAEILASLVEQMPVTRLWEDFSQGKYGNYYHNIHGFIEHSYYHLGQIVLIKKLLAT
jgi:uncharacterized damage-inducible protein DinB